MSTSGPINTNINSGTLTLQNKSGAAKVDSTDKKSLDTTEVTKSTDSVSTPALEQSSSALNSILDGITQSLQTIETSQAALSQIIGLLREGVQVANEAGQNIAPPDLAALSKLRGQFNSLLQQVNATVEDAAYKGVNLLKGENLQTSFGAHARNNITTQGVDSTTEGLGIDEATFSSEEAVTRTYSQILGALGSLQELNAELAEDQAQIKTRQDFARETISTFDSVQESVDTDEGANLLALKIGQQLAQLAESTLASRDQQDLLRLF